MKDITTLFKKVSIQEVKDNFQNNGTLTSLIDACGFFICMHGWAKVKLDNREHLLKENDIYLHTPSSFVKIIECSTDLQGFVIKSSLAQVLSFLDKSVNPAKVMMVRENPCTTLSEEQTARLQRLCEIIEDRQRAYNELHEDNTKSVMLFQEVVSLAKAYFYELLYDYFKNNGTDNQPKSRKARVFHNFMLSLVQNHKKEREVSFYAREQYLSPRYFSTMVKEMSGHTASEWIIQIVVNDISQTLLQTDKSIKEIATEFNFPSQSFFGKYFKQYTGVSPKEFRHSHN